MAATDMAFDPTVQYQRTRTGDRVAQQPWTSPAQNAETHAKDQFNGMMFTENPLTVIVYNVNFNVKNPHALS
jgi:hypothetical protein